MTNHRQDPTSILKHALDRYQAGFSPELIELPESAVFPFLIPAEPSTARKSRCTGILMGKPTPPFVRRGRTIRYRLKDVLDWLSDGDVYSSTAAAFMSGEEK